MSRSTAIHLAIVYARIERRLGWPGILGLALLGASGAWVATAHRAVPAEHGKAVTIVATEAAPIAAAVPSEGIPFPPTSDIPLLLTRLERSALEQGLGWPKADYRIVAPIDDSPASVEVRCVLKGPYPSIRRFVTTALQDMPTSTLREFSLSRARSDVAEVEAKLSLVIYLADTPQPSRPGEAGAQVGSQ